MRKLKIRPVRSDQIRLETAFSRWTAAEMMPLMLRHVFCYHVSSCQQKGIEKTVLTGCKAEGINVHACTFANIVLDNAQMA